MNTRSLCLCGIALFALLVLAVTLMICYGKARNLLSFLIYDVHYKQGIEALDRKDYSKAVTHLSTVLDGEPDHFFARLSRARAYCELRQYDEAILDCDRADQTRDSRTVGLHLIRGQALLGKKNYVGAEEEVTKAISLDKTNIQALLLRASILADQEHLDRAIEDCNRAIQIDKDQAGAYVHRARLRLKKGDSVVAEQDYERARHLLSIQGSRDRELATEISKGLDQIKSEQK